MSRLPLCRLIPGILPLVFLTVFPASHGLAETRSWAVSILAQTDLRGELVPCHCAGLKGGSLSLRSTVFKQARVSRTPAILLEGGDFVPEVGDSNRDALIDLTLRAMEMMPYDAVGLGDEELALGREFLERAAATLPLVCANLAWEPSEGSIPAVRWVDVDGHRVAVTSVVDPLLYYDRPEVLAKIDASLPLRDPVETLISLLSEVNEEAELVVVIAHAGIESIQDYLSRLGEEGVDVMIQGHHPEESEPAVKVGEVELMIPWPRSRRVAQLTLEFDDAGTVTDRLARHWDLKMTPRFDPRVEALVQEYRDRYGAP